MASSQLKDTGPAIRRARSAQESRIPRGPRTRSQANSATDPVVEETRSGIQVEKSDLEEKLAKLGDEIRQETKKKFDEELSVFQKRQELLKSEFHSSMEELTARVVLVEKLSTDAYKGRDPEVLNSLKLAAKDARRDANQALETLAQTRNSIDDRFYRALRRLKDFGQAAGRSGPRLDAGPLSDGEEPESPTKKDRSVRNRDSKWKSSMSVKGRKKRKNHCSDDREKLRLKFGVECFRRK